VRPRPGCVALLAAAAVAAACQRPAGSAAGGALAGSGGARANAAYDEGVSWATKAETAPLPTPPPLLSPLPKGAEPPPAPEFKPEEIQAVSSFERAIAAQPDDPRPHLALAELLAPHAVHRLEVEEQAAWKKKPVKTARGKPTPPPPPTPDPGGVDYSVARIVRAYEAAIQNDPSAKRPVEALVAFAVQAKDLEAAEGALQELVKRVKESPEPFLRYGDFLLTVKKDPDAAIEQYRQALIWRPDDEATKAKVAGIYIDMGSEAYARKQYAIAQSRFSDAAKYVTDKGSPQGLRLADYQARLREIRGR
jgi:tetratricopeptide (TPR) repeat protein